MEDRGSPATCGFISWRDPSDGVAKYLVMRTRRVQFSTHFKIRILAYVHNRSSCSSVCVIYSGKECFFWDL